jgi:hypothetical protein
MTDSIYISADYSIIKRYNPSKKIHPSDFLILIIIMYHLELTPKSYELNGEPRKI